MYLLLQKSPFSTNYKLSIPSFSSLNPFFFPFNNYKSSISPPPSFPSYNSRIRIVSAASHSNSNDQENWITFPDHFSPEWQGLLNSVAKKLDDPRLSLDPSVIIQLKNPHNEHNEGSFVIRHGAEASRVDLVLGCWQHTKELNIATIQGRIKGDIAAPHLMIEMMESGKEFSVVMDLLPKKDLARRRNREYKECKEFYERLKGMEEMIVKRMLVRKEKESKEMYERLKRVVGSMKKEVKDYNVYNGMKVSAIAMVWKFSKDEMDMDFFIRRAVAPALTKMVDVWVDQLLLLMDINPGHFGDINPGHFEDLGPFWDINFWDHLSLLMKEYGREINEDPISGAVVHLLPGHFGDDMNERVRRHLRR